MHHVRVLLRRTATIHIVVHVVWHTGHHVRIVPAAGLHIAHRVLHILLLRAHKAANVSWNLTPVGALPLVWRARTSSSPIHYPSVAR